MSARDFAVRVRELARTPAYRAQSIGPSRALRAIEARERLEGELQPYLDSLVEAIPGLVVGRAFYDGQYVVGVSSASSARCPLGVDAVDPHAARPRSRIEFAFDVHLDEDALELVCRCTAREKDLEPTRVRARLDAPPDAVRDYFESACLGFARRELLGES